MIDALKLDKPYYVILTGSKNNAGDYLIKYRAKHLFSWLRPDRSIVDIDGWKPFDKKTLDIVNGAEALILMGGPALQEKMRPRVYGLLDDLSKITAPIVTMGIGWYSQVGSWNSTHNYPLNKLTTELLARIGKDGFKSSVRDYHTLNVLNSLGYDNYFMTGCPALYDEKHLEKDIVIPQAPKKIGFSLGVSLKSSARMFKQMQDAVLKTKEVFGEQTIVEVVFHHAVSDDYVNTHGAAMGLHKAQQKFLVWLKTNDIPYVDISGSAESLIEYYETCDLHIGYRVHAHIFMSSVSKASILLNEDGRGIALKSVIGGVSLTAYDHCIKNKAVMLLHKFGIPIDNYTPAESFINDFANIVPYEANEGIRFSQVRENITHHFKVMERFLRQLP